MLVNFQCQGVLLNWIIVWQGSIVLVVGGGGGKGEGVRVHTFAATVDLR